MEKTTTITMDQTLDHSELFGIMDKNLTTIRDSMDVELIQRDNQLLMKGPDAEKAADVVKELIGILESGEKLDTQKVAYVVALVEKGLSYHEANIDKQIICYTQMGKPIKPKTLGQKNYVNAIQKKDIVFGIGPAGTGKTYLAVAMAASALKRKEVQKIILARPAVEAGESLGFLPGDLQEKVDPYLRPLYDALYDIMGRESTLRLKEKEIIEIVPLAYMRGRTLDNSFIILDEAQNTTKEQMKMFLTRMGFDSRVVVTGDITQIDLPKGRKSGLIEVTKILRDIPDIEFCFLKDVDVVRHELVKKIINAYDAYYTKNPNELDEG